MKKRRHPSNAAQPVVYAGPRVVQLEWKLPSRLRKPIREQLAKERAVRKRRAVAAVTFARKPIRTQALLEAHPDSRRAGARVREPKRFFNRGAEHHTADVYAQSKPQLRVAAPPYLGRVARVATTPTQKAQAPVSRRRVAPRRMPARPAMSAMPVVERDIPMQWQQMADAVPTQDMPDDMFAQVAKPKRVLPGLTFSLWPKNWFGGRDRDEQVPVKEPVAAMATSKKKRLIF